MELEDSEEDRKFLREFLQIDGLDSVLFALNKPGWSRGGGRPGGSGVRWGRSGSFSTGLYDEAMPPLRMDRRMSVDLASNRAVENLYLFLPGGRRAGPVSISGTTTSMRSSPRWRVCTSRKLLAEVRTRVRMAPSAGGGGDDVSRSQRRGAATAARAWPAEVHGDGGGAFPSRRARYASQSGLEHAIPVLSAPIHPGSGKLCHIVMSSHDPLVFAGLTSEQVRVMRRGG